MNYFAHALNFLDDPWVVAGTAVPDWLNVADRPLRVRRRHAEPFVDDADACMAALARGIVQHHHDDAWFHDTPVFHELSWQLAVLVRDALPGDEGFRPSFLGHILVEILLDAVLIDRHPERLEAYYAALGQLDAVRVQECLNRLAPRPTQRLAPLIPLFCRERFLADYFDDNRLTWRLCQVMRRVGLPELPASFRDVLPQARHWIAGRADELLTPADRAPLTKSTG
jgi:hypothetical protein